MVNKAKIFSPNPDCHTGPERLGLRYAMWAHAAALSPAYSHMSERFYQQGRECLDQQEGQGSGGPITVQVLQISILVGSYELKYGFFYSSLGERDSGNLPCPDVETT